MHYLLVWGSHLLVFFVFFVCFFIIDVVHAGVGVVAAGLYGELARTSNDDLQSLAETLGRRGLEDAARGEDGGVGPSVVIQDRICRVGVGCHGREDLARSRLGESIALEIVSKSDDLF